MSTQDRIVIIKSATTLLLTNLVNSDWIGLIIFTDWAYSFARTLTRATSKSIKSMIAWVESFNPNGGTNYADAFNAANNILKNSRPEAEAGKSPCKTFITLMTDGVPSSGITDEVELLSFIDNLEFLKKAIIFTYALGSDSIASVPMKIACMRNGIFEVILTNSELVKALSSYFIAIRLGMNNTRPLWVEPYIDMSGLGLLTTCSIPVYDRTVTPFRFLGVIGMDISMADMLKLEPNINKITSALIDMGNQECNDSSAIGCQMASLRNPKYKCVGEVTTCAAIDFPVCNNPIDNVFCNTMAPPLTSFAETCCGTKPQECTVSTTNGNMLHFKNILIIILGFILLIA